MDESTTTTTKQVKHDRTLNQALFLIMGRAVTLTPSLLSTSELKGQSCEPSRDVEEGLEMWGKVLSSSFTLNTEVPTERRIDQAAEASMKE